jgi:hypothetical protein
MDFKTMNKQEKIDGTNFFTAKNKQTVLKNISVPVAKKRVVTLVFVMTKGFYRPVSGDV